MTLSKVRLSESLELSVISTERFKSELMTFTISHPRTTPKSAACGMLLAGILKRGTEKYPDITSINQRLDELYASAVDVKSSCVGKAQLLTVTADLLNERYVTDCPDLFDGVLEMVEETLIHPRLDGGCFPTSIFEQEKKFLIDSIEATVNNTRAYATIRLSELIYGNDKDHYTLEEIKDIVESLSAADVTEYFRAQVLGNPIDVFYVGAMPVERLKEKLLSRFGSWEAREKRKISLPYPEPICEYREITEKMSVSQGKLAMGFKLSVCFGGDESEYYAALMLNELFGGSAASKLFVNVREKMSLCYYCSSSYNKYTGVIAVSSGIESKNRELMKKAILSELEDIKNGRISEQELTAARTSLINAYNEMYDNPDDLQSFFGNRGVFGLTEDIEISKELISKVKIEEIVAVAQRAVCDSVFFIEGKGGTEEEEYED